MTTAVTVFVDDAVQGNLPPLCAVSGRPTESTVFVNHRMGGMPAVAWLLLLLGPLGILLLLLVAALSRTETLTVEVPMHDDEWLRSRRLLVLQWGLFGSGLAAIGASVALASSGQGPLWLVICVACVVAAGFVGLYGRHFQVGIRLDASRRWVTLSRVHPDFAAAYNSARRDSRESASAGGLSGR